MTKPTAPLLEITGISKRYGQVRALDDVNIALHHGEAMALLGENGAGKSTLVKILSGLVQPDKGAIRIEGAIAEVGSTAAAQAAGIAVVQQEISAVGAMTVAENLVLGQVDAPRYWSRRRLAARARRLLAAVGLGSLDPNALVEDLSLAETQLIEVARVVARDARIVVFDEPTAALADREIERVLDLVARLTHEGRGVVYVTHRLNEVFRVTDRVTILRDGRVASYDRTADLDERTVVTKMIGRDIGSMFPPRGTLGETVLTAEGLMTNGLREPVQLTVRAGEILGLTGQLGSGAVACIELLAGVRRGTAQAVLVRGESLSLKSRAEGLRHGIAYCSSDRKHDGIFANLSVLKNLSSPWIGLVARMGFISRFRELDQARRAAIAFAIPPERLASHAGALSGGNQQKVALAKWLGTTPKVMLVEEPTRGVDVGARAEIYAQLRALCEEGMAIIISSSDTLEVLGLCDTIGAFYHGRLVAIRAHQDWTETALLSEVMHPTDARTALPG